VSSGGADADEHSAESERGADGASGTAGARSRYIPAEIRREVYERDEGACTFVDESGRRCGERWQLTFEHLKPWARGGEHTLDNLTLRCKSHNLAAARDLFGEGFIEARIAEEKRWRQQSVHPPATRSDVSPPPEPRPSNDNVPAHQLVLVRRHRGFDQSDIRRDVVA
jgi:hypothetical protein